MKKYLQAVAKIKKNAKAKLKIQHINSNFI